MTKCYWDYIYEVEKVYDNKGRKWFKINKIFNKNIKEKYD